MKKAIYRENVRRRADVLTALIFRTGVLVSVLSSAATLGVAFYHLSQGLMHAFQEPHHASELISAVEIFLLSPLPYLVLRSLGRYAEDFYYFHALKPSTRASLIDTKCFMVGLLFTMLIAHFVGRFISSADRKLSTESAPLEINFSVINLKDTATTEIAPIMATTDALFGCAILLILILFYYRLEIAHGHTVKAETDEEFLHRVNSGKSS